MNPNVNFVYFDIGGVFFNWRDFFFIGLPKSLDRSLEDIMAVVNKYDNNLFRGELSVEDFWGSLLVELNINQSLGQLVFEKRFENFRPYELTHQFAQEVAQYYPIGLLSNLYQGDFEEFSKLGLIPNLDFTNTVISCQVGLIKPEPAIYELATNQIDLPKESILFIDDIAKNTEVAKNFGWQTYLFDENNLEKSISELRQLLLS